jgi:hypothetical protein
VFYYLLWRNQSSNGRSNEEILEPFLGPRGEDGTLAWPRIPALDWDGPGNSLFWSFAEWMAITMGKRTLYVTENKYIGVGPTLGKEGDVVVVAPGIDMPLVLRPMNGHYLLVGPTYVHGIMDGEALRDASGEIVAVGQVEIR